MQKRFRQRFSSLLAAVGLSFLFGASAFAVDKGPLDAGTRLLVQEQPILQLADGDTLSLFASEADEDLNFTDVSFAGQDRTEGFSIMDHAAVMGGCITSDNDGNVVDDRFLISVGTYMDGLDVGLRLLRVDPQGREEVSTTYPVDDHEAMFSLPGGYVVSSHSLDVAASDWTGDGYVDLAIFLPGCYWQYLGSTWFYDYRRDLFLVDGKPDENGHFTVSHFALQSDSQGGTPSRQFAQGRIAAGDVDDDGVDEIVLLLGNYPEVRDHRNQLAVYEITEALDLESGPADIDAGETEKTYDGLDVAVGDFRGTGHVQIATVSSNKCQIAAKVWEVQDGSLKKVSDLGNVGELPETTNNDGVLRCVAGDMNGDGRDELVWAGADSHTKDHELFHDYPNAGWIATVVHTNLSEDGGLNFFKSGTRYPLESDLNHPAFDMTLGYFSEGFIPSDTTYPNKMQLALAVRKDSQAHYGLLKWDGSEFTQGDTKTQSHPSGYPVIVAGDLTKETLALGDPLHYQVLQQLSPVVAMQGTPRHWDRIGSEDYDAFSAFNGYKTAFSLQNSSTETAESSSQSSVSSTVKGSGSAGFKFLSLVDTKLQASFAQSKKDVEDDLSKYTQSKSMKLTAEAATDDWLYYTFQDLEIWRYPILGQAGEVVADDVSTEDVYYQVVYPANFTTKMSGGRDKEWYAPVHENLNLLSYPNDVEYIADYPEPGSDKILFGGPDSKVAVTVGADVSGTQSNSFNSVSFEQEKDSHGVTNSFDGSLGLSGKLFGVTAGLTVSGKYDDAFTETSTNSVNLSNAIGFTTAVPAGSSYLFKDGRTARSAKFDLYETAFLTEGKQSLVAGYAVDLLGSDSGPLWTDDEISPYRQLVDPALNLPQKWELQTVPGTYSGTKTKWVLCESETTRKKLRGGFALQPDEEGLYDDSTPQLLLTLDNPDKIKLQCRVYNYSFAPTGPVEVKFSYSYPGPGESGLPTEGTLVEIGTVTLDEGIRAWTRTGMPNWELAEMGWDTGSLAEGSYWIHVEIDPNDKIVEIHDTGDEAGNNEGWYQVGLVKETTLDLLAEKYLGAEGTITAGVINASDADLEDVSFTMANLDAGEGETTLLRGVVANNGDEPMALVHVDFFERFRGEWNLFDEDIIPLLMPGQTRTLEIPFMPSSSTSDVKMVINPSLGEADFENNTIEITRSSDGSGGCSIAPFPALMLVLPLLGLLKR